MQVLLVRSITYMSCDRPPARLEIAVEVFGKIISKVQWDV